MQISLRLVSGSLGMLFFWLVASLPTLAQAPAWQSVAPTTSTASSAIQFSASDGSGNIVVAGYFSGTLMVGTSTLTSAGGRDVFVAKYSPATGTYVWAQRAGSSGGEDIYGLAVSGASIYIAGFYSNGAPVFGNTTLPSSVVAGYVAKLTDTGSSAAFTWAKALSDGVGTYVTSLAVSGNSLYLGGDYGGASLAVAGGTLATGNASGDDAFVVKITDTGSSATFNWGVSMGNASANFTNYASVQGLVVSGNSVYAGTCFAGGLTLAGTTLTSLGSYDLALVKILDAGNSASVATALRVGGGTGTEYVYGMGRQGNTIYLSGVAGSSSTWGGVTYAGPAGYVAKVQDSGSALSMGWAWVAPATSAAQLVPNGTGVYVSGNFSGTIPFGSSSLTSAGGRDGFVARLNDAGSTVNVGWAQAAGGAGNDNFQGLALSNGKVYASGTVIPVANFGALTVATPPGTGVAVLGVLADPLLAVQPQRAGLAPGAYPNPAHAWAVVPVSAGTTELVLLDALGREVRRYAAPTGATEVLLDLRGISAGPYVLRSGSTRQWLTVE
ncbi:hypothetical protein KB206_14670 [Microvirga sp. STS02]|uniref:hypothetical protein n=1 Tax=Hymenobacter negativus TaxID=2795026 RepID=UPI0018DB1F48|nr:MULTISPECIES: hypothetical protein [Bacteria]MBH8570131.1 hypothetical protein [Hymenobacter negativus]MBR7209871.1 hypothetical protein [Microvirga sp. STS02]